MPVVSEFDTITISGTAQTAKFDRYLRDTVGTTNNLTGEPTVFTANIEIASPIAGGYHTIFLDTAGKVYGVGSNGAGRLGFVSADISTPTPITYFNNNPIFSVSAGESYTIFLDTSGKVYSAGLNTNGQLGVGDTTQRTTPTPIPFFNNIPIAAVSCGGSHTIFLDTTGKVYAVGLNTNGQLGLGDTTQRTTPVLITFFNTIQIASVSAGNTHTIFQDTTGKVYSVGLNTSGQLGLGDTTQRTTPFLITYFNNSNILIKSVITGYNHTIFLDTTGKVYAAGINASGQLGLGDLTQRTTPTPIPYFNTIPISSVSTGGQGYHTIFVDTTGKVYAVGQNTYGQLGLGDTANISTPTPITYFNTIPISLVFAGAIHTMFLDTTGKVYGVGYNGNGLLGLSDNTQRTTPVPITYFTVTPTAVTATVDGTLANHKLFTLSTAGYYLLSFPAFTIVNINNGPDIAINGNYKAIISTARSSVLPAIGNTLSTIVFSPATNITGFVIRYHLRIPTLIPKQFVVDTFKSMGTYIDPTKEPTVIGSLFIKYPETPPPTTQSNSWTDKGYNVICKSNNSILGATTDVNLLFNNSMNQYYHSTQVFSSTLPFAYSSATPFKGINSLVLSIDLGRSIYLRQMSMVPWRDTPITPLPGIFNIYASNDASCWNDNNHSSWTLIHSQTTSLTFAANTNTYFGNFSSLNTPYRYFAMAVYNLNGNYAYLIISEWGIFGEAVTPVVINDDYKYMAFTYDTNQYPTLAIDSTNLIAWYKLDGNLLDSSGYSRTLLPQSGGLTYGIDYNNYLPYAQWANSTAAANSNWAITPDLNKNVPLTFAFWFRVTATGYYTMIGYGNYPSGSIQFDFSGGNTLTVYTALNTYWTISPTVTGLAVNTWYFCTYVLTNDNPVQTRLYINGVLRASAQGLANQVLPVAVRLTIANSGDGGRGFEGNLGDIRIYDKALSLSEIQSLYAQNQKNYTVNFPVPTICDILVVGGGGAGGVFGGGGGGGAVLFKNNITLNGSYSIKVGKGGVGNIDTTKIGENGNNSSIIIDGVEYIAVGGGGGGSRITADATAGNIGGSGGGGGHANIGGLSNNGGVSNKNTYLGWESYGNVGGAGKDGNDGFPKYASGGGGGAGGNGLNWSSIGGGNGGFGIDFSSYFGTSVGHNGWFAGGGGGHASQDSSVTPGLPGYANGGVGLFGGGGDGATAPVVIRNAGEGLPHTGGGGGGAEVYFTTGTDENKDAGDGGSGVVIIRYPVTRIPFDAQWTYSAANANVYHLGNVGIGTTNPTNALHIVGDTFSTTYSGGSKNFKIEHPLKINKWLYHGCIEGPRFDNIYRGKKLIINGKAEVDIDKECNTTGGMTSGTFPALNTNYQLYLQNNKTFDRVKGSISGSKIQIESLNVTDEFEVDWLVVGERHDQTVINPEFTDSDGNLICEHYYPGYNKYNSGEPAPPERIANIDVTEEYTVSQQGNTSNVIIEEELGNTKVTSNTNDTSNI
jgi:alpha-tubulin suppressor-like RCC1 family protein